MEKITVKKLIKALLALDPELRVVVRSNQGGYEDIKIIGTIKIAPYAKVGYDDLHMQDRKGESSILLG